MPELPELETYRRHLAQLLPGQVVQAVEVERPRSLNVPANDFEAAVAGIAFEAVRRRGKLLIFDLPADAHLLCHLMLGGWLFAGVPSQKPAHTAQISLHLKDGRCLYFFGLRLGWLHLLDGAGLSAALAELGPEPFTPAFSPAF